MMRCKRQDGFSLVEVLVTTIVFSFGVLGIMGLNGVSKSDLGSVGGVPCGG